MIRRQKVQALVLSRKHVGEADRLVMFFTRQHGLVKAVAKGVRRIPSHRGGHLELYTSVLALLSETQAGTYVSAVQTQEYFDQLHQDDDALYIVRNISFVVTHLFHEFDPQEELYDAVEQSWRILPTLPPTKRLLAEGAITLAALQRAGLMPDLRACRVCGTTVTKDSVLLDARNNGWVCLVCHSTLRGTQYSLPPRLLNVLRFMVRRPQHALRLALRGDEGEQLMRTLRRFVADSVGVTSPATEQ